MRPGNGTDKPHEPEQEPGDTTSLSRPLGAGDRANRPTPPAAQDENRPLANAVERWRSRGYTVRYDDGLLVQLRRRETPGWRTLILLLLALGAFGLGAALLWLAWRSARRWSVVSLTQGPDQRIITHRQLTNRPPDDETPETD